MPAFWIGYRPLLEMQHQLGANHMQKLSESLTGMGTPLSETSTLTMPERERYTNDSDSIIVYALTEILHKRLDGDYKRV